MVHVMYWVMRLQTVLTSAYACQQVLCNEAGVPIHEMRDDDVAARELTLDSKMRAFFRLSNFSHRYELNTSSVLLNRSCLSIST